MSVLYQVLGTFIVCWTRMSISITFYWPSSTVELFRSDATPLDRPMTDTELALFGSIAVIGAMVASPILGLLMDVLGRKKCMLLSALLHMLTWTLVVFSRRVEILLLGMLILGLSCGVFVVIPVHINEICQPHVRGAMASCMILAFGIGMLCSYLIGGFLEYKMMCYVCLSITILGVIMMIAIKESPVFLMRKGREDEAAQAMAFYRNAKADSRTVMLEIEGIRKTLQGNGEVKTKEEEQLTGENTEQAVSYWQFLKTSKSTRKAATLTFMLMNCNILQGFVVVSVYAGPLFKEAVPSWSPVICSVVLAGISIVASLISMYLVDVAGRRPLLISSSVGSAVCWVLLGSQIQFLWAPNKLNAIIIFIFCFTYMVGAGSIPFVLAAEVFLPKVSGVMSMLAYEHMYLSSFILLLTYGPLVSVLGLGGVFYLFAGMCLFTAVYCMYCLPETKGLTVDAIQKLFLE